MSRAALWLWLALSVPVFAQQPGVPAKAGEEGWLFNPLGVKRDPFVPPGGNAKKEPANELRQYDLNEINLVAIMTGLGAPQAMVMLPNGKTHIIQERDPIGRHNGRIYKIRASEVVIEEAFKDFKGRDKKSFTNLVLAQ